MTALNPTPPEHLVDAKGRPYFLWDTDQTLESFRDQLVASDPDVRAYAIGKLMRQAKPDDVFTFVTVAAIRAHWDRLERYLGQRRAFWHWLLGKWQEQGVA
jgi:hypothetical protein